MSFSALDHTYMTQALALAAQGLYTTSPNPRVGCVIVKNNQIIGQGAHLKAGEPHAEVHALREAGAQAQGADAYVTLEPCNHHGRTPPCVDALITAGVKRVVVAMQDPNPLVAGQGITRLRAQGITVDIGLMADEALALNVGFIKRMTQQQPYVRCKIAASLDGATALSNGVSQWITSEAARLDVQHWRAQSCAIITGIGTILADNPNMNMRLATVARQPLRVIVDRHLRTPLDSNILKNISAQNPVLIAYASASTQAVSALQATGAHVLHCSAMNAMMDEMIGEAHENTKEARINLKSLCQHLAKLGMNDVLLEAGAGLNSAFLQANLIDEYIIYLAPKFMGSAAKGMFALPEFTNMQQVPQLEIIDLQQIGPDIRLRAKPVLKFKL